MFQIVQFTDGRYGIQNAYTGIILCRMNGEPFKYRTLRRALNQADKRAVKFNKLIFSIKS